MKLAIYAVFLCDYIPGKTKTCQPINCRNIWSVISPEWKDESIFVSSMMIIIPRRADIGTSILIGCDQTCKNYKMVLNSVKKRIRIKH